MIDYAVQMDTTTELLNILDKAQSNYENRTRNNNISAGADPNHELTDNSVTKSNALTRAYYRFGLVEKRCMEALISKLNPLRSDNLQHIELKATDYAKAFKINRKHAYEHLASAADALLNRVIVVRESPEKVIKMTVTAQAVYEQKAGKITVTFNPLIVPHLIGLREKFTSYPLKQAVDFSSSYTWRFYELLVSWARPKQETGGHFVGWLKVEVAELRDMLGVPESYTWSMFNKRVLEVAQQELMEKAHIHLEITLQKTNRRITHLHIRFIEDPQPG
jgi:plasmid replication initiation protein